MAPKKPSEKTVISVKVDKDVKEAAQEVARSMGLGLSTLINAYLLQVIETRHVEFFAPPEQMTPKLEKLLKKNKRDFARGKYAGPFDTIEEGLAHLDSLKKKKK